MNIELIDNIHGAIKRSTSALVMLTEQFEGNERRELADHIIEGVLYAAIHEIDGIKTALDSYVKSQNGIDALQKLVNEYKPTPKISLIDERLVYSFIEHLMFLGEDSSAGDDSKHRLAEFWSKTSQRDQAKHLLKIWQTVVEFSDPKKQFIPFDPFETQFNYTELKNEINAEFKARHALQREKIALKTTPNNETGADCGASFTNEMIANRVREIANMIEGGAIE